MVPIIKSSLFRVSDTDVDAIELTSWKKIESKTQNIHLYQDLFSRKLRISWIDFRVKKGSRSENSTKNKVNLFPIGYI